MFFLALPIYSNAVSRIIKIIFSLLFPPITMQLGINTLSNFQTNFNNFKGRIFMKYNKYSVFDMYLLYICNYILYMFLGFYIQNIISHEYGIKKPWYFLFTKAFWGCENSDLNTNKKIENEKNIYEFEEENEKNENKNIILNIKNSKQCNKI